MDTRRPLRLRAASLVRLGQGREESMMVGEIVMSKWLSEGMLARKKIGSESNGFSKCLVLLLCAKVSFCLSTRSENALPH